MRKVLLNISTLGRMKTLLLSRPTSSAAEDGISYGAEELQGDQSFLILNVSSPRIL